VRASLAIGVSGVGSNMKALHAVAARGELGADLALVFADRPCPAVDWAAEQGIETAVVPGGADDTLAEALGAASIDLVVLAGYMRLVGPATLAAFEGRILNTHPSLLPAFPGSHAVRDALAHGVKVTGATLFVVDGGVDTGPIVAQTVVAVEDDYTVETLHERIKVAERQMLVDSVGRMVREGFTITDRKVRFGHE